MNRKLTFLSALMVIVTIFALTSTALADELLPLTRSGEWELQVGDVGTILSVEADEGASIQWFREAYGSDDGAKVILGENQPIYVLTADRDTAEEGLFIYYAVVNGVKSEIEKIVVSQSEYEYSKEPMFFRFDSEENKKKYISGSARAAVSLETLENGKTVLKLTTDVPDSVELARDVNVQFDNFNVPVADYAYAVYKIMPMTGMNCGITAYHSYDGLNGPIQFSDGSGFFNRWLWSIGVVGEWQYVVDDKLLHPVDKIAGNFPNGVTYYDGSRFDFYDDSPGYGSVMYIESVAFFATRADCDYYIENDRETKQEQPSDLDMVAWEFKNDPSFAITFLPETDIENGAKFKAGVKTKTSLMSRNKFNLDMYSVVKVLGADKGTLTFYDGETELGEINLAEGNIADFTDEEKFPNWTGEFTDLQIKASDDMTIEAIAFFVDKENAELYNAKAYPCDVCGKLPCVCPTKPLKFEDAIWWNFADTWTVNNIAPINANVEYVGKTKIESGEGSGEGTPEYEIAHGSYTVKEDGDFALRYRSVNMKASHKLDTAEYPFIKIGYRYNKNDNGAAVLGALDDGTQAYIKFTTDRVKDVTVNFKLEDVTDAELDENGYYVISLDFSSLTELQYIDPEVAYEFRGALDTFEFGIYNANAGDVLDVAYMLFFKDNGQYGAFNGDMLKPAPSFVSAWNIKNVIKNDYATVDAIDIDEDGVEFKISDFSRISRLALEELKKYHPNTMVSVLGDGYEYHFNTSNVKSDLKTWYYELDVYFAEGFSGDVYRQAIKKLVPEEEYVAGIHFVHKFMKNTDLPFVGKLTFAVPEEYEGKYLEVRKYNARTNTLEVTESALVKDGKVTIGTLGGDLAIVYSGYQPTEEEIACAEAFDVYENTPWDLKLYDFSTDGDEKIRYFADDGAVQNLTENGVTFKRTTSTSTSRIQSHFIFKETFEASEYPVMVIKYRTSDNYSGSPANYVSTEFYMADYGRGYPWLNGFSYYGTGSIYSISTDWTTKVINYANLDTMKASGLSVNEEWVDGEGAPRGGGQAFPFKGNLLEYRLDFSTSKAGVNIDVAYIAFFKTEEEARKYSDARSTVEKYTVADEK